MFSGHIYHERVRKEMKKAKCSACGRAIPDPLLGGLVEFEHRGKMYDLHESCARTVKASPNPEVYLS